ncbi:MAG TPA: ACT domain-containing protein [Candidatus Saccharimonadales bacterium]|nr:ACT domain-containing protein [Candidatus Saccharimonadales bacterium]
MNYLLELTLCDQPGVLVRVAQIFARRGCNIQSLTVNPQAGSRWSTMHIAAQDVRRIDQVVAQLRKLVDIQRVTVQNSREGENIT